MYLNQEMFQYFQELNQYLEYQNKKIQRMESAIKKLENIDSEIKKLQDELAEIKEKPSTNIERIEYKFDQLKVETLEGTLNIGLTPNGDGPIDDFSVNQDGPKVPPFEQMYPNLYPRIHEEIHRYLREECNDVIADIEDQESYFLDAGYRKYMIEDVQNQIDHRIHYYLNQRGNGQNHSAEDIYMATVKKVKDDIYQAFASYIKHLPRKEG